MNFVSRALKWIWTYGRGNLWLISIPAQYHWNLTNPNDLAIHSMEKGKFQIT